MNQDWNYLATFSAHYQTSPASRQWKNTLQTPRSGRRQICPPQRFTTNKQKVQNPLWPLTSSACRGRQNSMASPRPRHCWEMDYDNCRRTSIKEKDNARIIIQYGAGNKETLSYSMVTPNPTYPPKTPPPSHSIWRWKRQPCKIPNPPQPGSRPKHQPYWQKTYLNEPKYSWQRKNMQHVLASGNVWGETHSVNLLVEYVYGVR